MKTNKNTTAYYPAWLWMVTITLPAIFFGLVVANGNKSPLEAVSIFLTIAPTAFFSGFVLSFPVFLLLSFTYNKLIETEMSVMRIRLILMGIALVSMLLILFLLGRWLGFHSWGDLFIAIPYAICIFGGTFLFKIKKTYPRSSFSVSSQHTKPYLVHKR